MNGTPYIVNMESSEDAPRIAMAGGAFEVRSIRVGVDEDGQRWRYTSSRYEYPDGFTFYGADRDFVKLEGENAQ